MGKKVQGTVVRFADYGAFLKLEKDINGLVHLTELAHHKVTDPGEVLTIGQKIDAQVINIDVDERRIGLSVKALKPIDKETMDRIQKEREEEEKLAKEKANASGEAGKTSKEESAPTAEGFVASKTGKKYYPAGSTQAEKIKEENRVMFKTEEDAKEAGYTA